jgi:hypothetical protein
MGARHRRSQTRDFDLLPNEGFNFFGEKLAAWLVFWTFAEL